MKSGTQIMLEAQAKEAGESYLALFEAAKAMLARYVELVQSGDCGYWDCDDEKEVISLRAAIKRCESWHSTLPRKEDTE